MRSASSMRRAISRPREKARAEAMVHNLIAAFSRRIDQLDWMAPETKAKAKAKLAVLKIGVGYPDRWLDYSALDVRAGRCARQRPARRAVRDAAQSRQARQARGPRRVGHDAANRQRRESAGDERDELPGRDPAAAVLRSEPPGGDGLRLDRRDHRPRDQPQLRRPGRAVRLHRQAPQLVDAGGLRALQGGFRRSSRSSTTSTGRSRISRSTVSRC